MKRREFFALLGAAGAAAALPRSSGAVESVEPRRLGVLLGGAEQDLEWRRLESALDESLRNLGWAPGRDLRIDYRWPGDEIDRIQAHAIELVELGPEVIVTATLSCVQALRRRSDKIPIVFLNVADPVSGGLVSNLAKPGGLVTGFTGVPAAICTKWLEIVKELAPKTARLAMVFNPETAQQVGGLLKPLQTAAQGAGMKSFPLPVRTEGEAERAIEDFGRTPNGALVALPESSTVFHRTSMIEAANRAKLPALFPYRFCATGGALVSYGIDLAAQCKGSAEYVDKILRGRHPGELAVQAPTKFELVINSRTARLLNINLPPALLARADEVIE